jgi:hypothetical protein
MRLLGCRSGGAGDHPAVGLLLLVIGMPARQLHHHPAWSVAGRVAELVAQDWLELMATENLSVTAAFNLSHEDLTLGQQRLFRRLGLHHGTDIDAFAAAALDALAWPAPAAPWRPCTTSICSPSRARAVPDARAAPMPCPRRSA